MATAGTLLTPTASPIRFDLDTSDDRDDGLSVFAGVRSRLFGIAYRMLGSVAEAEDIVQDVWLRWQFTNRNTVENPPAFLAMTTTRLCINLSQSAHARRETYIGDGLPETADTRCDPASGAERDEALRYAVQILFEKLSPSERAAYILREAFDYSYRQIADVLCMEEATTRQLVCRARKHIADSRRTSVTSAERQRLLQAFMLAAQSGEIAALENLLAGDVVTPLRTEPVPDVQPNLVQEDVLEAQGKQFPIPEFVNLTLAAAVINGWNSFGMSLGAAPAA